MRALVELAKTSLVALPLDPLALSAMGFLLNAMAGSLALWRGFVDPGGGAAGIVIGTFIFAAGGLLFWLVLAAFVLSSSALGKFRSAEKKSLESLHQKSGRRDLYQVMANGGIGTALALLYRLTGNPAWAIGFAVSLASSNADTWASEVGELGRREPVSLLTFRPVPKGISGGVSPLGLAASVAGALLIALIFAAGNTVFGKDSAAHVVNVRTLQRFVSVVTFITTGGFLGSLVDSFLGAALQAQYTFKDPDTCMVVLTERRTTNGAQNKRVRGLSFVNNDVVNLASCAAAAAAGVLFSPLIA